MKQLHPLQRTILVSLSFNGPQLHSELKPTQDTPTNHLSFHLNTLLEHGLVEKKENYYQLSQEGKMYANRIDSDKGTVEKQSLISVVVCPIMETDNGRSYLCHRRTKEPFFGKKGFLAGKSRFGETLAETAMRELTEESGLVAIDTPRHVRTEHTLVYNTDKEIIHDQITFYHITINPTGVLTPCDEGEYTWIEESSILEYVDDYYWPMEYFHKLFADIKARPDTPIFEDFSFVAGEL